MEQNDSLLWAGSANTGAHTHMHSHICTLEQTHAHTATVSQCAQRKLGKTIGKEDFRDLWVAF